MKILVTGGLGYIGSITVAYLLEAGHEVVILDDLSSGNLDTLPEGIRLIKGDVRDIDKLLMASDKIDVVFHQAALVSVGESVVKPELYMSVNTLGSKRLLRRMRELGIKKLVFTSSSAVYGNAKKLPLDEKSKTKPISPYGKSKLDAEELITNESKRDGLAAISLRLFNVVGTHNGLGQKRKNNNPFIPRVFETILGNEPVFYLLGNDYDTKDGTSVRDFVHVSDIAKGHLLALKKLTEGKHSIFNLGNNNGYSNLEVIKAIEKVTGKKVLIEISSRENYHPGVLLASGQLAKDKLGWKPSKVKIEDIVTEMWDYTRRIGHISS